MCLFFTLPTLLPFFRFLLPTFPLPFLVYFLLFKVWGFFVCLCLFYTLFNTFWILKQFTFNLYFC